MAGLTANTSIKLGVNTPKKDAVVATGTPVTAANEITLWAKGASAALETQVIRGYFDSLLDYAKSNMPALADSVADPVVVSMPLDGGDPSIVIDGTPGAADFVLEVGTNVAGGSKSHFLNRTHKRICERWLEQAK